MTDAQLDAIYEAALADDWEEQNHPTRDNFQEWDCAVENIGKAENWLKDVVSVLNDAARMVENSTEDDRILSIASEVEFLMVDLKKQKERMTA